MKPDPKVQELLGPFAEPGVDPASRRFQVDREKIVSRMVEVSLAPEERFGSRARVVAALALAASFALASWGALKMWQRGSTAELAAVEVVAVRGAVTSIQGPTVSDLGPGKRTRLVPQGTLETARGAEAHIKTASGIEIELLEGTLVALNELAGNDAVALRLARGRVRCIVPHRPGRTFAVVTPAARVVDVGTTFSVGVEETATGPQTFVLVEEGEVLVQRAGQESRLTRSQTWTSEAAKPAEPPAAPSTVGELGLEPTAAAPARHESPKRRPETLAAETKLLRSGLASEQKGDLKGAVTAFETLTSRYPESQLAPDAKSALARVKGRLESSK